jgi:tetratricopeptide (TPR) repeat protein
VAAAVVALAGLAAYARTLPVPFLFDDIPSIQENTTIQHLGTSLAPAADTTVSGRPVVNLSLALDYALAGLAPWVYHATNIAVHVLAALLLLGIVRRTLVLLRNPSALPVAFCVALLWVLHPMDTESVTYVIQRAESVMGLFFLATLYCFIRAATAESTPWLVLSVAACFVGMATKEAMATAPLVVLLYDRTFLAGSFQATVRKRWKAYCALSSSWILLGCLIFSTHGRTGTVGFGGSISALDYAKTQAWAVGHYLRLAVWPSPLVFDYGRTLVVRAADILPGLLTVIFLVAATLWALVRRPVLGFLGACFLVILAPSSSFIPVLTETVAEHRMYLALIPVVAFFVLALDRWFPRAMLPACCVLAAVLLAATWLRNETYRSAEDVWRSVVEARPANERAHNNLGFILASEPGRLDEAVAQYRQAIALDPAYAQAHLNLAMALAKGQASPREAAAEFRRAIELNPTLVDAHFNLAIALTALPGHTDEVVAEYQRALLLKPDYAEAHFNLGCAYGQMPGRADEAITQYREALRISPGLAAAHFNLGCVLVREPGRLDEAIREFRETLRLEPRHFPALCNLAIALGSTGHKQEAIARAEDALRIQPGNLEALSILASLRGQVR